MQVKQLEGETQEAGPPSASSMFIGHLHSHEGKVERGRRSADYCYLLSHAILRTFLVARIWE
jgi:hypothetical protein